MRALLRRVLSACQRRAAPSSAAVSFSTRPDHLTRTAAEPREDLVVDAKITGIRSLTPTVRELDLRITEDSGFCFRPGNWVDFFIPGVETVGGYSICSIPEDLPQVRLAIKTSKHPPAAWCHSEEAAPGASVQMKAGGSFYFDARENPELQSLVLVAGGIGINPPYAMLQEALAHSSFMPNLRRITLMYSAATASELAYRDHIEDLAKTDPRVQIDLRVTRGASEEPWHGKVHRIDANAVLAAVGDAGSALVYICGPPQMTDQLVAELGPDGLGFPKDRIRFEKWW